MAEEKKENEQEMEETKPLSAFEEKMKGLLDELVELLDQVGGNYGPILMEELQNRLELIVKDFNDEANKLFNESFKKWKVTDGQLREFISNGIIIPKDNKLNKKPKDSSTPKFIKEVDFGPVRPK